MHDEIHNIKKPLKPCLLKYFKWLLWLPGKTILFNAVKFLGMRIQVQHDSTATKETLVANLKRMLQAVDMCLLTYHQKLRLYKAGVCLQLSWLLLIEELP